jgi:uncharacterized protein (DUF1501 family)
MMNRRDFLKALTLASAAPIWVRFGSAAAFAAEPVAPVDHMLLVIYLAGGNDGLNTVAPYLDADYKRARPTIGLKAGDVFPLATPEGQSGLGLNNALPRVKQAWTAHQLAIIHNVGYPKPNFSHFDSTYIWETASPEFRFHTGWVGRYLDATDAQRRGPVRAVGVGMDALPRTLIGTSQGGVALTRLGDFTFADDTRSDVSRRRSAFVNFGRGLQNDSMRSQVLAAQAGTVRAVDAVKTGVKQSKTALTPAQTVAGLFAANVGTEVGFIQVGGFDTHTGQKPLQASQLKLVDTAITEFFDAATALGIADRVTVMTFSDFGRRVGENANNGTDHGSSTSMFVMGPRVRGQFYGSMPDLANATLADGNLKPAIDMRSVYGSVLSGAFHLADVDSIMGGSYPLLPLLG